MDELSRKLAPIRVRVLAKADAAMPSLEAAFEAVEQGHGLSDVARERAFLSVHNLGSVSGTLCLPGVMAAARAYEYLVEPWLYGEAPKVPAWRAAHQRLRDELAAAWTGVSPAG